MRSNSIFIAIGIFTRALPASSIKALLSAKSRHSNVLASPELENLAVKPPKSLVDVRLAEERAGLRLLRSRKLACCAVDSVRRRKRAEKRFRRIREGRLSVLHWTWRIAGRRRYPRRDKSLR